MARRSPNGRPLTGKRLDDTAAIVANGIRPPQGCYELHWPPSAECMVTPVSQGGTRPEGEGRNASPDKGTRNISRAVDYLERRE